MKISTDDLKKIQVSYFRDAHVFNHVTVTLYDCLVEVPTMYQQLYISLRELPDDVQKQRKVNYPLFVASAVCGYDENGKPTRKHDYVVKKNNIIIIDIDEGDNQWMSNPGNIEKLKKAIFSMNYVYAVSKSIRGKGLFVVIPIENADNIVEHFNAIEKDFRAAGIVIDKSCKDLTRSRFLSYDPDIMIKENTEVEVYDKRYNPYEVDEFTQRILNERRKYNRMRYESDLLRLQYALDYLFDECLYSGSGDYNEWIHEAFMLTALVDDFGYDYCLNKFLTYSMNTPGFKNTNDVVSKFSNIYNTKKSVVDVESYYYGKLKKQIGSNWVELLNRYIEKRQINKE